jgi:glutathione peroxidase
MKPIQFRVNAMNLIAFFTLGAVQAATPTGQHLLDHEVRRLGSDEVVNLKEAFAGKVVLIVNTASQCAFTGQYEGLEALYDRYRDRGLVVLGFPSNDFGNQEPGTEQQIQDFCRLTYSVKFPMFAKTSVRKGKADPLFQGLAEAAGRYPKWNFHKYLVDRDGRLADNYLSWTSPQSNSVIRAIEELL